MALNRIPPTTVTYSVDIHPLVYTRDYFFDRIGDPVSIKPPKPSFSPPFRPETAMASSSSPFPSICIHTFSHLVFAVSINFALQSYFDLGFCVGKTKDVITLANEIKEKCSPSSILELSFVAVLFVEVQNLALSFDNSTSWVLLVDMFMSSLLICQFFDLVEMFVWWRIFPGCIGSTIKFLKA